MNHDDVAVIAYKKFFESEDRSTDDYEGDVNEFIRDFEAFVKANKESLFNEYKKSHEISPTTKFSTVPSAMKIINSKASELFNAEIAVKRDEDHESDLSLEDSAIESAIDEEKGESGDATPDHSDPSSEEEVSPDAAVVGEEKRKLEKKSTDTTKKSTSKEPKFADERIPIHENTMDYSFLPMSQRKIVKEFGKIIDKFHDGIPISNNSDLPKNIASTKKVKKILDNGEHTIRSISIYGGKISQKQMYITYLIGYGTDSFMKSDPIKYSAKDGEIDPSKYDKDEKVLYEKFVRYSSNVSSYKDIPFEFDKFVDTDCVYQLKSLQFSGVVDVTRNLPIGRYGVAYSDSSIITDHLHDDYRNLFSILRIESEKTFTRTNLKKMMKLIYQNRYLINHHEKIIKNIDGYWDDALKEIQKIPANERTILTNRWTQILSSTQARNIILRNYPCTKAFESVIIDLLKLESTRKLLVKELFKISFLFGPFAIYFGKVDKIKESAIPSSVTKIIDHVTHTEERYEDCNWVGGVIRNLVAEDQHCLRFWLNNSKFIDVSTVQKEKDNNYTTPVRKRAAKTDEEEGDE